MMKTHVIMEAKVSRRLFTVQEYHQMAEAGILHEDDRVELIHGEIIQMSPIGNSHSGTVRRLIDLLYPRVAPQAIIDVQNPVRINEYSEPEPDIAILPFREDYYTSTGVTPSDVLLLIEVSDTTGRHSVLRQDRNVKLPLYASANIAEVWIIDVSRKQLEVYRQPSEGRY